MKTKSAKTIVAKIVIINVQRGFFEYSAMYFEWSDWTTFELIANKMMASYY